MKLKNIHWILLILIISSCKNDAREHNQTDIAKNKMIDYFQKTLIENFGKADNEAVRILLEGIIVYDFNYIIKVDQKKLLTITNNKREVLHSYFYDYSKMASKRIMPANWTQPALFKPYAPMSATAFNFSPDTYWSNEIKTSQNPFIKSVYESCEAIGDYAFTAIFGLLKYNLDENLISVSDKETITFLTFAFWEYLCYCGNVDFITGSDKTESIIRNMNPSATRD